MNIRTFANLETEIDHLSGELWEKKKLITELCDALEEEYGSNPGDRHASNLLQRAREATR